MSKATTTPQKKVQFDRLCIRTYKLCLGDNPAVTVGPPLSMEWQPIPFNDDTLQRLRQKKLQICTSTELEDVYSVDDFESARPRRKNTYKRPGYHGPSWIFMLRSAVQRQELLMRLGVTAKEMNEVVREVHRVQRGRWLSMKWYFHPLRTVVEFPSSFYRYFNLMRIDGKRRRFIRNYQRQSKAES